MKAIYLSLDLLPSELLFFTLPFHFFLLQPNFKLLLISYLWHKSDYYLPLLQCCSWNSIGIGRKKGNLCIISRHMAFFPALTIQCSFTLNFLSSTKHTTLSWPYVSMYFPRLKVPFSYLLYLEDSYSSLKAKFRCHCSWEVFHIFLGREINYLLLSHKRILYQVSHCSVTNPPYN